MKRMRFFGLLLSSALAFSMLASTMVFAQTGSLEVTCSGPSGAPEKDVKVTVLPMNSTKGKDKKSNATGIALFDKMDNGAYRVVGRKDGFAPVYYEIAFIQNDKVSVALKMAAGADSKLYFEDPMLERQSGVLLQEGLKASEAGNHAEAEKSISQSLAIIPSGADALYYLGIAQLRQGKFDQATESLKKAAEIANVRKVIPDVPGQPPKQQIYEQIVQNATQQISLMPVMRAQKAAEEKKFDEAVVLFDEAIKANPQLIALYTEKAIALTQAGRLDEADAAVNRVLELNPGDERAQQVKKAVTSRIANAALEKENEKLEQAKIIIDEGTKLLESDAAAALKKFQEANTLTGEKYPAIWRQLARAQAKLNNESAAIAAFNKSVELAPADQLENYQMSFAQFYLDANNPDKALDLFASGGADQEQKLLDLIAKHKNRNPGFAEAALERVIKLNPANDDAYYELGRLYYADGREKDVRTKELLDKYVEIGKDASKVEEAKNLLILVNRRIK